MIIKNLESYSSIYGKVDAILIVNKNNIIEYSAMVNDDKMHLRTENLIGRNLFEVYPNLNEENSTHSRVMRTGQPVVNEKQMLVEKNGRSFAINTSTFPLENDGEIIGTIEGCRRERPYRTIYHRQHHHRQQGNAAAEGKNPEGCPE